MREVDDDPRGKLFEQYVSIVKEISPKLFVLENVKGTLTMQHYKEGMTRADAAKKDRILKRIGELVEKRRSLWGDSHAEERDRRRREIASELAKLRKGIRKFQEPVTGLIKREFQKIGYHVEYRLFNAADFGVPQSRERVIFIGVKDKGGIAFPERTHSNSVEVDAYGRELQPYVTLKDAIGNMSDPTENPEDEIYRGTFSSIYMSRNRLKQWDDISFTIQAGARHIPLHPSSSPMVFIKKDKWKFSDPNNVRRLSTLECARIQTFPDGFKFAGSVHGKIKQIGNAVPPLLAQNIGKALLRTLEAA